MTQLDYHPGLARVLLHSTCSAGHCIEPPSPNLQTHHGGRNSVLIAPGYNLETEEALDVLFATPKGHAYRYIEWICYTSHKLQGEFHSHAFQCWQEMWTVRCQVPPAPDGPLHLEPTPSTNNHAWRQWLKERQEHPQFESKSYPSIPLVTSSYQMVHIEGAKALIAFVPCRVKGGTILGSL